ncbi:hypothetical protein [uncultured Bacteroides sp.]|uniref:hypothetical protein n=1 Tax=uncultured Bacteroides sp. TaxID=162156 RepID=UPI0023D592FB|nr:hypothetical protein [uncultured Bacteroides sp.]MDE5703062.1 hypothetical protein [Bacteroides sp.]MDE6172899.1 hypothetical protein [Bacteroides sp.]
MKRKTILTIITIVLLLVGVPFFMYGEDGYSFPQALLMIVLIAVVNGFPADWRTSDEATKPSVVKQIVVYTVIAAVIVLLLLFFNSKRAFGETLCVALGITLFLYISNSIIDACTRKMVKK